MKTFLCSLLSSPLTLFGCVAFISAFSLAAALTSEVVFGLEPCILCIYQRIPFVLGFLLSLTGLILYKTGVQGKCTCALPALMALNALAFLINSGIAFYHTGVERHWWRSAVEGCAVPNFSSESQSILENILSAPTARCDEIPWQDPLIGLSMANYNVVLCLGLFAFCALGAYRLKRFPAGSPQP